MSAEILERTLHQFDLPQADWIGIREVREKAAHRMVRDGKPYLNETTLSHGARVEVLAQGQFGYAATSQLDPESLRGAAIRARDQALKAARFGVFSFQASHRPPVQKKYQSPFEKPLGAQGIAHLTSTLVQICEKLKRSPKIVRTLALAQVMETEVNWVSTNGSRASQNFSMITTDFEATAEASGIVQKRTDGGFRGRSFQGGWEYFETGITPLWAVRMRSLIIAATDGSSCSAESQTFRISAAARTLSRD